MERAKGTKNANHLLQVHEDNQEQNDNMATLTDIVVHLAKAITVNRQKMILVEDEIKRWCEVIHRLVEIIQSLAKRNLV